MAKKNATTQSNTEEGAKAPRNRAEIKDPEADVTPGQGRSLRIYLGLDCRTMEPKLNKGQASQLLNMVFALVGGKKDGTEVQVQDEDGKIKAVKVTKAFYEKAINDLRAPLINAGATDKKSEKKKAAEQAAPVIGTFSLDAVETE